MDSLTREQVAQISLPKWPALTVVGEKVTPEQAMQIIIRTNGGVWFSSNDKEFTRDLYKALGVETDESGHPRDYTALDAVEERYQIISPLEYLCNQQIVSAFIGGPHGWCNWNGDIFCNSYNIGKWPDAEVVLNEWAKIAEAFPFLSLKSQLFSGEVGDPDSVVVPVVEFQVSHGEVTAFLPEGTLVPTVSNISVSAVSSLIILPAISRREQGCTLDQFRQALELCDRDAILSQEGGS